MKKLFWILSIMAALHTIAEEEIPCPEGMDFNQYLVLSTEGGFLYKPHTGYGAFVFVNSQNKVSTDEIKKIQAVISDEVWVELKFSDTDIPGEAKIEIVDNLNNESTLAIYPDEKRAVVNVAALSNDNPTSDALAARTRKEALRAFSFLAGISGGGRPGTLLDVMTDMKRLDAAEEVVPGELVIRNEDYLKRSGIKPYIRMTYRDACQEGWAPQPKNAFEQKIWDEVHTIPAKPIKIKYQKK